jgi:hypothetical protein
VFRHVDLVSAVVVLEKRARIPHGFALSWDIETALVSPLTCFTSAPRAGAGGATGERPIYVSSYRYMCVLILNTSIQVCKAGRRATPACCAQESYQLSKCPHTAIFVSILLYVCPHAAIYVSSYYYLCPHAGS